MMQSGSMPSGHRSWERMPPPPSIAGDGSVAETEGWGALGLLVVSYFLLKAVDSRTARR
jgi:hypothetical protein